MSGRKRITATDEGVKIVTNDDGSNVGGKLGAAVAYILVALLAVIAIGGLVWVAEVVWRAVLR